LGKLISGIGTTGYRRKKENGIEVGRDGWNNYTVIVNKWHNNNTHESNKNDIQTDEISFG